MPVSVRAQGRRTPPEARRPDAGPYDRVDVGRGAVRSARNRPQDSPTLCSDLHTVLVKDGGFDNGCPYRCGRILAATLERIQYRADAGPRFVTRIRPSGAGPCPHAHVRGRSNPDAVYASCPASPSPGPVTRSDVNVSHVRIARVTPSTSVLSGPLLWNDSGSPTTSLGAPSISERASYRRAGTTKRCWQFV